MKNEKTSNCNWNDGDKMKAKVLAVSVVILFLMIGLSGCDEIKEELDKPIFYLELKNVQS